MSGARLDRGENELALAELEIAELNPEKVFDYSPQLFRAYADTLDILGRESESKRWFTLADRADAALAAKNAPDFEILDVIEEIEIPAPYESKRSAERPSRDGDRADRPRREFDRGSRDGDRPRSDRPRPGSDRQRSDRPGGDRPRPASDRPRSDRPSSDRPRNDRPSGDRPDWKKKRGE